jgi:hypothetical protein
MKNKILRHSIFSTRAWALGSVSRTSLVIASFIVIMSTLFVACEYENNPATIYDPSAALDTTGKPVITGIAPATQAVAGVREITITGTNMGVKTINGTPDTPWVVIGGVSALIKDIQSTSITIYRPRLSNDNYDKAIYVSVTDPNIQAKSSSIPYMVDNPGATTGDYSSAAGISATLNAIDFDNQEYLYAEAGNRNAYKTDFAGVTQIVVLNPTMLPTSAIFNNVTAMSFGPGLYKRNLYFVAGRNSVSRIYVTDTSVANNDRNCRPVTLTTPAGVSALDFDENGNVYVGGNGVIYTADTSVGTSSAPTFTAITGYETINIRKIRVFKAAGITYLYVSDSSHVWRSQLASSLDPGTPLVNLGASAELSSCAISSFDLDVNGTLYLCLQHHPQYSLFVRENDGSVTPFYSDASILPNTVDKIAFGPNNYLYLVSGTLQSTPGTYAAGRIYRLILDRNGAPYYGRTFIQN